MNEFADLDLSSDSETETKINNIKNDKVFIQADLLSTDLTDHCALKSKGDWFYFRGFYYTK